jgi:hypothetical protein
MLVAIILATCAFVVLLAVCLWSEGKRPKHDAEQVESQAAPPTLIFPQPTPADTAYKRTPLLGTRPRR